MTTPSASPALGSSAPQRGRTQARPRISFEGLLGCFAVTAGGLMATAALGGLRVADLVAAGSVMAVILLLALRDSRNLPVAVLAVWMYTPLLRRVVDWQSGGFQSVTALSLLPVMATSALLIRALPRVHALPRWIVQPLAFYVVPVVLAAAAGLFAYGPSAIVEATGWLVPVLFLLDAATRPTSDAERRRQLRIAVVMATLSAAYGIYQFFAPPVWDQIWLVQSGMTSSMGRAEAQQLRAWGTLNDTGLAACVWALALITAFADRHWRTVLRYAVLATLAIALCLTLVRIGWIVTVAGIIAYLFFRGGREGIAMAATALIAATALLLLIPFLPGSERVLDRATSFTDLQNDNSYQARQSLLTDVANQVADAPWGRGIGFQAAAKVAGTDRNIQAFDNGYANVLVSLGLVGGPMLLLGFALLFKGISHRHAGMDVTFCALNQAIFVTLALATAATIFFTGLPGVWLWWTLGMTSAPPALAEASVTAKHVT